MHGQVSTLNQQTAYRPEIDGLRAIAVVGVMLFHANLTAVPGGFVGVNVFFVISGYLITGIISDSCRNGTFSFLEFYGRRARRILPALIVVMVCALAAGWLILLPIEYESLAREATASALFVPNFLFWSEAGYFDRDAISKPLLHLWSLGIEEQFYLLWPMVLVATARNRILSIGFLILLTAGSFALCVHLTDTDQVFAFYLPPTRVWELSLGALLASVGPLVAWRPARSMLAIAGLAAVVAAMVLIDSHSRFPGAVAALPTFGTAAVIWSGRDTIVARALSFRPVVYIGLISYPLYLWHWPLLSFADYLGFYGLNSSLSLLAASFVLAVLTYELLEKRVRKIRTGAAAPRLAVGLAATAIVAVGFVMAEGRNYRYRPIELDVASIVATMKYDYGTAGRLHICWLEDQTGPQQMARECTEPDDPNHAILVWGDSYAAMFASGVRRAFPQRPVWQTTRSSCIVTGNSPKCDAMNADTIELIRRRHPRTVIIFDAWENYSTDWTTNGVYGAALQATLGRLRELKIPDLIVIGPNPYWSRPGLPPTVYAAWERTGQIPSRIVPPQRSTEKVEMEVKAIAESSAATFLSMRDLLCNAQGCLVHVPGKPGELTFWDYGHLTMEGAEYIASNILNERPRR